MAKLRMNMDPAELYILDLYHLGYSDGYITGELYLIEWFLQLEVEDGEDYFDFIE